MGNLACSFFSNLFTSELRQTSLVTRTAFFSNIAPKVTLAQNDQLIRAPTESEIKMAAFGMSPNRCAGPDGFSGSFFQQHWTVVGPSICSMIKQFMEQGHFDSRLNETVICLIPKKQRPTKLTEFRPISLCNFAYKILSKLLATRLKSILPNIISETQAAFVQGRLISDNILLAHELLHSIKINPSLSDSAVAIKTDMMKAFDRVEWQFLEDALTALGFNRKWTEWILHCVSSVSYGVIVNGKRFGHFSPSRGLRQGDPLSPFLFILCTEILIMRLNRGDPVHQFLGIQVTPSAPPISHLFFADDSLFFSSVNEAQLRTFKHIIAGYEELSGQRVNSAKSSLLFGPKVSQSDKDRVKNIIGITQEGGRGIYLGMPETFLGSKVETLQFVEEKIKSRINSWKNRYLSQGGKEVLLKAVVQAIPTYVMSCYSIPKTLTDRITADMARFWWKNQETGKGIHWKTWSFLTRKKAQGGINFRHVSGFNMALLAKQVWRLCLNPHSLLAQVLQAKYFAREPSIMYAKLGQRPSFGWKSLMDGKSLLSLGLKKEFGNGEDLDLWRDPWIIDSQPRPPRPRNLSLLPTLHQLKEPFSDEWNRERLREYFDEPECARILTVKPGGVESKGSYSWIYNNSGLYSVKSGYWLWDSSMNQDKASEQLPNFSAVYEAIWKVNASNKIRHFLWRCLSSSLPVQHALFQRQINMDASCRLCGDSKEDINHLLFTCDLAREVWSQSPFAPLFMGTSLTESVAVNLWALITVSGTDSAPLVFTNTDDKHIWPWLLWRIWKARNEFLFQRATTTATQIIQRAKIDALEWLSNHVPETTTPVAASHPTGNSNVVNSWEAPEVHFLKCNIDATWQDSKDACGSSWILRDHTARVRLYGMKCFPKLMSSLEAEAAALVWAVNCMWNMGYDKVIFETDSANLISALNSPQDWPRLVSFTTEIQGILARRPWEVYFKHISRRKNEAADLLAKQASLHPIYFGSIDCFIHTWLQPSLGVSP